MEIIKEYDAIWLTLINSSKLYQVLAFIVPAFVIAMILSITTKWEAIWIACASLNPLTLLLISALVCQPLVFLLIIFQMLLVGWIGYLSIKNIRGLKLFISKK